MMTVLITLTIAGSDTGPFDLYSDADGFVVPFEINVPKASLVSGYTSTVVPDGTVVIRVMSDSICTNFINLLIGATTTSTTSTTSTTTTVTPPVVSYNCVDGNCNEIEGDGGTYATLEECQAACGPPVYAYSVRLSNILENTCTDAMATVWSTQSSALTTGDIIYVDSALTTPVITYTYVVDDAGAPDIYNLNPANGQIGADTTLDCA